MDTKLVYSTSKDGRYVTFTHYVDVPCVLQNNSGSQELILYQRREYDIIFFT